MVILAIALTVFFTGCDAKKAAKKEAPAGGAETAPNAAQQAQITIEGANGYVDLPDGNQFPLTEKALPVPVETTLVLNKPTGLATVVFPDGGSLEIKGNTKVTIKELGFVTRNGRFMSSFRRKKNIFEVQLPMATLGIRGTRIDFDLQEGVGAARLLDGKVQVIPAVPGMKPFEWTPGETLTFTSTGLNRQSAGVKPANPSFPPPPPSSSAPPSVQNSGLGVLGSSAESLIPPDTK